MQRQEVYPASPGKARCTLHAVKDGRHVAVRGASFEDLVRRLRELCPGGTVRELWAREEGI